MHTWIITSREGFQESDGGSEKTTRRFFKNVETAPPAPGWVLRVFLAFFGVSGGGAFFGGF